MEWEKEVLLAVIKLYSYWEHWTAAGLCRSVTMTFEFVVLCCHLLCHQFTGRRSHWPLEVTADASTASLYAQNRPTRLCRSEVRLLAGADL